MVRIPAGASSINIQQNARSGRRKDDNYIAVRDGGTGEYLVNGGFILSMFKKSIIYGDIIMDYTGSDVAKERLNSTKPIPKDLIVEVLTVGDLQQPNLTYSYLVPRDKLVEFRWRAGSRWTHCDKLCTGRIHCNKLSTGRTHCAKLCICRTHCDEICIGRTHCDKLCIGRTHWEKL